MEKIVLKATKRTVTGKQVSQLRRQGKLPAVIYGHNVDPVNITLEGHNTGLVLPRVSASTLITIDVEGKLYPVLVREKQRNYIKNQYTHIDFLAVSLTEKIRAHVTIEVVGEAPAIKDFNAAIVTGLTSLTVEALPQDLPEKFTVDISSLKELGDGIYVRDIVVSDKVKVFEEAEEMIVVATATREEALDEGAGETLEAEVIEKGKKEEE